MNYIDLINHFWALNKEYSFTPNEKAVYFALLNKCNELGWKNPFNQSNGYLAMDSGMSESAMQRARNILQQKGLIKFRSGDGRRLNSEYLIAEPSKKIEKGLHKGTLKNNLSATLSDTLSDTLYSENRTDNIKLKTKQKETKLNSSKSHSAAEAAAKKKNDDEDFSKLLWWKSFVARWDEFYLQKKGSKYRYLKKDFAHLKKIHEFLKLRSTEKKFEFTEENLLAAFEFYLNRAWEKDDWLRNNFSLANLLSQFNQIANGTKSNSKTKPATGADVSVANIFSKIAKMPD